MKKGLFFILFILISGLISAQKNDDYKNWIVDYTQSRRSMEGVQLDKLELNDRYTVAHMSFHNWSFGIQMIEACNTFHIRHKGKRIAYFVKAENIPTRKISLNTDEPGFSCADETTAMKIKPGQFVRFRIYFTRIPEYLNTIDIIEYDGYQSCEFDIFNLNISKKEPLPSSSPSVAAAKPATPPAKTTQPQKPAVKPQPQTTKPKPTVKPQPTDDAIVASKAVLEPEKKPKVEAIPPKPTTSVEKRDVAIRKEYVVRTKIIKLELWDNDKEDGDQVSIMLNKRWILRGVAVTKNKKLFEIPLQEGENTLVFHADNLGTAPPNTAAIKFNDGQEEQTIVLNSDMDKSEAIRIIRN